jgi:hypothetical protein
MIDSIDKAVSQIESLGRVLKKANSKQVQSQEERSLVKATALSWFTNLRPELNLDDSILDNVNEDYKYLLEACEKGTKRESYFLKLKSLRHELIKVRSENILHYTTISNPKTTSDIPPNFDVLIKDLRMKNILLNRWDECIKCIKSDAPLAATVMMGGMLEAILLAKINALPDKAGIFKLSSAPLDKKTGKVIPLQDWTLRNYIDISHEIGWISQSAKDVGEVLRDYRNYIHPYKEFSHGTKLIRDDAELFWNITKNIIKQLLSAKS